MLYLSGAVRPELYDEKFVGFMLTPNMGNAPVLRHMPWAADTGCFTKGDKFRLEGYLEWLRQRRRYRVTNLFATAPDVLADARATWQRSLPVFPKLRQLGYRSALVGQDGLEEMTLDWDRFDVLFLGGSTEWKLSQAAADLAAEAVRREKWVHMGRVNSLKRLQYASDIGCSSADGTFLCFGPEKNLPRLRVWVQQVNEKERTCA